MPAYFLAKTEPDVYSIGSLEKDLRTIWDGIKNPQALRAVRAMQKGDRVLIYHSGGQSEIVGVAKVVSEPREDPKDAKLAVVEIEFVRKLDPPTKLSEIKASHLFDDWALVRQSRLSTMEVPDKFIGWLRERYSGSI